MKVPESINSLAQSKYYKVNPNYRTTKKSLNNYLRNSLAQKALSRKTLGIKRPKKYNMLDTQSYVTIQKGRRTDRRFGEAKKLTWQSLQGLKPGQLRNFFDSDFDPLSIINQSEDTDNQYLNEFGNVGQREKDRIQRRKQARANNMKKYGA